MKVRRVGTSAVLAMSILALAFAPSAMATGPALFRAGAAVRSIDPPVPVFSGGFSLSPPIRKTRDPLQVRAFYVNNGRTALAFVVIDAQGYFSGYQEGADLGATADRADASRAASAAGGVPMTGQDIIVQATHTHAGPTLEGIWGPVPPAYLTLVHQRIVAAVTAAAQSAQPAHLEFSTLTDPSLAAVNINQDNYQGWITDPQLSALRAVDARTGASIGSFINVPTHGAHICGQCDSILSADYFGAVRASLDRRLGGVNVVGPASLGRLESPVETTGAANMEWIAGAISNDALEAFGRGRWITSPTLGASETRVQIPATNAALLALNDAWTLPDAQKQQEAQGSGIYPIDRANTPPFRTGTLLGSWLTALRIGDVAFLSMPGEPFPEVRLTIARATHAQAVVALSKGQDDFGYFYPAYDYVFPQLYNSDHAVFNVAPQAGDQVIHDQVANAAALGFPTDPALEAPLPNDYAQKVKPGLQSLASPATGDAGPNGTFAPTLQAIYMPAAVTDQPLAGQVHWSFGDGTQALTPFLTVGQDFGQTGQGPKRGARFKHAFRPGTYHLVASGTDTAGNGVSWRLIVRVYPRLRAAVSCHRGRVRVRIRGGEGTVLRRQVRRAHGRVDVTVLDAAGGMATARARCR